MGDLVHDPANPDRRITDRERDSTVARLRVAVGEGSLDLDELEERIEATYRARTAGELARLVHDLPVQQPDEPARQRRRGGPLWRNEGFRGHATVYTLVNGFLVGIWAVTGADFFWPFFPAGSWGIGLGAHAMGVMSYERHRAERAARRAAAPGSMRRLVPPDERGPARPAAFASPARSGHERVAVLFTDVVASTQLTAALGDLGWSQLRSRHRETVGRCLRAHGGAEVSISGDGILARFPDETSAVRCAVDIHRALRQQQHDTGFAPRVRTGVHAGEVVVTEAGDVLGGVVNLACRVAAEAEPDEVLVTEAVRDRLSDRFALEDRGLHHLKGIDEPRHLLAVRSD